MQKSRVVGAGALRFRSAVIRSPHDEYGDQAVVLRGDLERAKYRKEEHVAAPPVGAYTDPETQEVIDEGEVHHLMMEALETDGPPIWRGNEAVEELPDEIGGDSVTIEISSEIRNLIEADDLIGAAELILKTGRKLRRAEEGVEVAHRRHREAYAEHEQSKAELRRKLKPIGLAALRKQREQIRNMSDAEVAALPLLRKVL